MKKAALHNLGCKVNAYETESMQQMLEEAGYEIVSFHDAADVYLINTCSVTNMADRKSRQMIHRAKKQNENAVVVATGCYVQTAQSEEVKKTGVDLIIGNNQKSELVDLLEHWFAEHDSNEEIPDLIKPVNYDNLHLEKCSEHTRAFIKVQDGCNQFCSYCIIPYARGRVRSRELSLVVEEITNLAQKGYKEVVLTGIHLSSYGVDCEDSLLHLIEEVHKIQGIERIRLGSLEPKIITEDFVKAISKMDKFCPHFHLSLQSGCDETLKRMNRKYTCEEFKKGADLLRKYFEHPAITTDVIVGFPMETEEEFSQTKAYVEMIDFYEMHIFKYSKRQGTKAASMDGQVNEDVKHKRSSALFDIERRMTREFREYYIGKTVEILVEEAVEIDGEKYFVGFTKEYVKAAVKAAEMPVNEMFKGKITRQLTEDYLLLEAE